jgi:hypothetical protein
MSRKLSAGAPSPSVASGKVPAPVRARLRRVNCDQAIPYPPNGQSREWWRRLKNAFGTASSAFVAASSSSSLQRHGCRTAGSARR